VDNKGFKYGLWRRVGETVYWRCCIRNSAIQCRATISQRGQVFKRGAHAHTDIPVRGRKMTAKIVNQVNNLH